MNIIDRAGNITVKDIKFVSTISIHIRMIDRRIEMIQQNGI